MTQIFESSPSLFLRPDELRRGLELLFFAHRDITAEVDDLLARHDLGRAHHRVLYFVARHPGIPVSGLLDLLGITKQSLSRVLAVLIDRGLVEAAQGQNDRRQKLLSLTSEGTALEADLFAPMREKMATAYRGAGPEAVAGFWEVLFRLSPTTPLDE